MGVSARRWSGCRGMVYPAGKRRQGAGSAGGRWSGRRCCRVEGLAAIGGGGAAPPPGSWWLVLCCWRASAAGAWCGGGCRQEEEEVVGFWFTRRVREDRVRGSAGGGRCGAAGGANTGCRRARAGVRGLPTCRLANLSACRFVGKLASAGSAGGGWRWSGRVPRRVREDRGAGCRWCGRGDCRVQCLHCAFIAECYQCGRVVFSLTPG